MKKGLKIAFCIVYGLALAFVAGVLLYRQFVNKDLFPSFDNRHAVTLCVALTIALIKLFTRTSGGTGKSLAYNNLASSSFHNGDYDQAIEYAKKCIEIKNDFLPSIKLLYLIYSLNEDPEQAELYARKAVANGVSKKELKDALEYYMGEQDKNNI